MTDETTLGGYLETHARPPAFEGVDGHAYSAAAYVDDMPDDDGRFGAALLFIRWSDAGDHPVGHLETPYLAHATTSAEAGATVANLTLYEVKRQLDRAIAAARELST